MWVPVTLVSLFSIAFAELHLSPEQRDEAKRALENPDLFEGDMAGIQMNADRSGIIGDHYRWPNGVVPFVLDISLRYKEAIDLLTAAMNDYHQNTCIRFKKRTDEENYLKIFFGDGCWSMVGMRGGMQSLSLGDGCGYVGTFVHELGHALGFYHEQSRSDRDDFLTIHMENVEEGLEYNFLKLKPEENILYNTFDYQSIMIYGNDAFSKNGEHTMVAKNGEKITHAFYKNGLNKSDKERINKMYNCQGYL